jgi:glyoxylase-like metal-dependent hydrolase (beta-lactamase superfamily II)
MEHVMAGTTIETARGLEPVAPGLHATAPQELAFARGTGVRAYLLERPRGDLLVYAAATLAAAAPAIAARSVTRHYLNHWHEAAVGFEGVGDTAPLHVHAADRAEVEKVRPVAAAFDSRHRLDDRFEIIPIPGHTPGATAYLWDSGRERVLFTGDSLYLRGGEWRTALLDSSDRAALIASLERLATLEFDRLVPWAAPLQGPATARTNPADAAERLAAIIDRLRRGGDH